MDDIRSMKEAPTESALPSFLEYAVRYLMA